MFKSYQIGTIYGIPFRLDVTFLVILPVFAGLIGAQIELVVPVFNSAFGTDIDPGPLTAGMWPWVLGLVAVLALFACVTLHELGHSAAALYYGYEVESITLWLLGGVAKPAEIPRNWVQEFWIAVAGPLVNLVIIVVCVAMLLVLPPVDVLVFLLLYLAVLNLLLAAFNMLPAFPLDGGRVLRALLARNRSYLQATRIAVAVGKGFALLLGLVGLLALDFILVAIAVFVYIAASSEARQMRFDAAFEGITVADVMTPVRELETVDATLTQSEFLNRGLGNRHTGYPVLENAEFVGVVTRGDVQSSQKLQKTVATVMTPVDGLDTVGPSTPVMEAFRRLGQEDPRPVAVVDAQENLVGFITQTDLMRAFKIVHERQESHTPQEPSQSLKSPNRQRTPRSRACHHRPESSGSTGEKKFHPDRTRGDS